MSNVACIDISHHQGFPDFAKVKAAGIVACIMKATEGIAFTDPNYHKNRAAAEAAGIACCAYFWLKPNISASAQANYFLHEVKPGHGERVVIDWEQNPLSVTQLCDAVKTLNDANLGLQVTIYCSQSPLMTMLANVPQNVVDLLSATDLWVARYISGTNPGAVPTKIWPRWSLWQFSEKGTVDGIPGNLVDLNTFNGTNEQLVKWIGATSAPVNVQAAAAPPPADSVPEVVDISIVTTGNTVVQVRVNGVKIG